MDKKINIFKAIKLENVEKIPTSFRATEPLVKKLMIHFGYKDTDNIEDIYEELLEKIGADIWSSGSKISRFGVFIPSFKGPIPKDPYIADGQLFYTIGINSKVGKIDSHNFSTVLFGVDPPLLNIEKSTELKEGFLTKKLELFDFKSMKNRNNNEKFSYNCLSAG